MNGNNYIFLEFYAFFALSSTNIICNIYGGNNYDPSSSSSYQDELFPHGTRLLLLLSWNMQNLNKPFYLCFLALSLVHINNFTD